MKNEDKKSMTLLEFIDKNGEGLAWFTIVMVVIAGGMVLQLCGR